MTSLGLKQTPQPSRVRSSAASAGPVVLLASTCAWSSTPKLAIALAAAGCAVAALTPRRHPLNRAAAVSRRFHYSAARPLATLDAAIHQAVPDLIIACDERAVEHLQRLHRQTADEALRALIERSIGAPDHFAQAVSRDGLMAMAIQLGLPTPECLAVRSALDLRRWAEIQPFPWVMKVDGSWGGFGVRIVSGLVEAEQALADLSHRLRPLYALRRIILDGDFFWLMPWLHHSAGGVTVQGFIEGRPANCTVAAWRGKALGGVGVEVIASDGDKGPASIVRLARDSQMLEIGSRLVEAFELSGLVGFDFIVEAETGRAVLLEMNPRATPISHLRLGRGQDPVGALLAALTGRPEPDRGPDTQCETIALFPQANLQFSGQAILASAYSDEPLEDPRLVRALLRRRSWRWPQRSWGVSKTRLAQAPAE